MADEHVPQSRAVALRRVATSRAVIELGAMAILAVIYNTIRAGGGSDQALAMSHARDIARIEGWVFHNIDLQLDHWIVGVPWLAVAACYFYALMHYVMTPTILVLSRRRGGWQYWRGYWALVVGSAIALVIYANWPLAPPRLMPELGTIDVMQHFAGAGWWGDAASAPRGLGDATNQFAAMPSLHCGWAFWGLAVFFPRVKSWWAKTLAVLYPITTIFVVVITGNHYWLDAIVGGGLLALAVPAQMGLHALWSRIRGRVVGDVALTPLPEPVLLTR